MIGCFEISKICIMKKSWLEYGWCCGILFSTWVLRRLVLLVYESHIYFFQVTKFIILNRELNIKFEKKKTNKNSLWSFVCNRKLFTQNSESFTSLPITTLLTLKNISNSGIQNTLAIWVTFAMPLKLSLVFL